MSNVTSRCVKLRVEVGVLAVGGLHSEAVSTGPLVLEVDFSGRKVVAVSILIRWAEIGNRRVSDGVVSWIHGSWIDRVSSRTVSSFSSSEFELMRFVDESVEEGFLWESSIATEFARVGAHHRRNLSGTVAESVELVILRESILVDGGCRASRGVDFVELAQEHVDSSLESILLCLFQRGIFNVIKKVAGFLSDLSKTASSAKYYCNFQFESIFFIFWIIDLFSL